MLLIFHLYDAVTSWRHVMTSQNLIYLSQLLDVLESWFFFVSMVFQVTEFKNVNNFLFVWCRDVMTSCHDVTKPDLSISACRCAGKLILFLFPWFCRSLSSKMLFISQLCYAVTSWRHVMTSLNLIHLSQLVDELESWFFFCFHGFVGHWVQTNWCFSLVWCHDVMTSWRHDVMSWRHRHCLTYLRLWIHWKDDRVQDSMVFLVAYSRNVSVHVFVGWYHVMTSRHDVTSILSITLQFLLIL